MANWLQPALDYIPQWLEYQLRDTEQPGCVIAIVHKGRVVLERAFGYADIVSGVPRTNPHSVSEARRARVKIRHLEAAFRIERLVGPSQERMTPKLSIVSVAHDDIIRVYLLKVYLAVGGFSQWLQG